MVETEEGGGGMARRPCRLATTSLVKQGGMMEHSTCHVTGV